MTVLYNISKNAVRFSVYLLSIIILLFVCVVNAADKDTYEIQTQLESDTVNFFNSPKLHHHHHHHHHQTVGPDIGKESLMVCEEIQQSGIGGTGIDSEDGSVIVKYLVEIINGVPDRCSV